VALLSPTTASRMRRRQRIDIAGARGLPHTRLSPRAGVPCLASAWLRAALIEQYVSIRAYVVSGATGSIHREI
jgi:hypothetical protein